ncbi:hypothetical protein [Sphingobium sp.]|uniref:hypothetical protein n=1 Tax=Sphingobium sp. TaxID=1912891 RepID=UPI0025D31F42|nr:hypothetical protein [Sphingobium sp.]
MHRSRTVKRKGIGRRFAGMATALLLVPLVGAAVAEDRRPVAGWEGRTGPLPPGAIVIPDKQNYFQGSYMAFASPWAAMFDTRLKAGEHFRDEIVVQPATFPDGTTIRTRWPVARPEKSGVWGYHFVAYGHYDGKDPPPGAIPPKQVRDIAEFRQSFRFSYRYSPNFNLLNEFYLTRLPGDMTDKLFEIGFFLHVPPVTMDFIRAVGVDEGDYTDSEGRHWGISRHEKFIRIYPKDGRDVREGTIDVREFLKALVARKVITGQEWFNGIAFGTEPVAGAGQTEIDIHRWKVDFR